MLLSKEQILQANDLKTKEVPVEEWGGTVRLQAMSAASRDAWETEMFGADGEARDLKNARAKLVARCLVDENNELLFTPQEVDALGAKSAAALDKVFNECKTLNGIGKEDIEELVGNSNEVPAESSSSD